MRRHLCCALLLLGVTAYLPLTAANAASAASAADAASAANPANPAKLANPAGGPIFGNPAAGEKVSSDPSPSTAPIVDTTPDFAKRDAAEVLLRNLRDLLGKDLDPQSRTATMNRLLALSTEELTRLATADRATLIGKALGSSLNDLTYTSMTPCRIFDSRPGSGVQGAGTGPLQAGTVVAIDVAGGAASCGLPFPYTKAAILNFTIVTPSGAGDLRAWPWASSNPPAPNTAVINYANVPGLAIANGLVMPTCNSFVSGSCTHDLFLRPDVSSAHLVIDVFGYMSVAAATALDCNRYSTAFSAPIGTQFSVTSPDCPAAYNLTGGGIELVQAWTSGDELLGSNPTGNAWQCVGQNGGGNVWMGNCYAVCCRTPGRP
jgi:hypothetical protein